MVRSTPALVLRAMALEYRLQFVAHLAPQRRHNTHEKPQAPAFPKALSFFNNLFLLSY